MNITTLTPTLDLSKSLLENLGSAMSTGHLEKDIEAVSSLFGDGIPDDLTTEEWKVLSVFRLAFALTSYAKACGTTPEIELGEIAEDGRLELICPPEFVAAIRSSPRNVAGI